MTYQSINFSNQVLHSSVTEADPFEGRDVLWHSLILWIYGFTREGVGSELDGLV